MNIHRNSIFHTAASVFKGQTDTQAYLAGFQQVAVLCPLTDSLTDSLTQWLSDITADKPRLKSRNYTLRGIHPCYHMLLYKSISTTFSSDSYLFAHCSLRPSPIHTSQELPSTCTRGGKDTGWWSTLLCIHNNSTLWSQDFKAVAITCCYRCRWGFLCIHVRTLCQPRQPWICFLYRRACRHGLILSISTKLCAVLCSYLPDLTFCQHLKPYFAVISSKSSRKLLNRATNSKHSIAFHEAFTFQVSNTQTASRSRRDSRLLEIAKSEWTSVFELKCNDVTGEYLLLLASFSWREMARNLNARFSMVAGNDVTGEYLLLHPFIAHAFTFCCHKPTFTTYYVSQNAREPWLSLTVSFFAHIPRIFRRYITVLRA